MTSTAPTTIDRDWLRLYREFPERYDEFAEAQDADEEALAYVRERVDLRGATILDIGAGSGRYTRQVAGEAAVVYCMEPCGQLLEVAQRRAAQAGMTNVVCQQARAQQVPLTDNTIDVVLAMHSLNAIGARDFTRPDGSGTDPDGHRFTERARAVDELFRVLRPGGWLFSLGPAPDNYGGIMSEMVLGPWQKEWSRGKAEFLTWMASRFGFTTDPIRGDWVFPDANTAARVYGFVYGESAARHIIEHNISRIDNRLVIQSLRNPPAD